MKFWNRAPDEDTEALKREIVELKAEIKELQLTKKLEEEDIKHMVKLKEERMEIESERKEHERDRKLDAEIAAVKDEYRDKMESRLEKEVKNIHGMYDAILQRLPNIEVALNKDL